MGNPKGLKSDVMGELAKDLAVEPGELVPRRRLSL